MARESYGGRAIIFIDEFDSLVSSRSEGEDDSMRKVKCEIFVQIEGLRTEEGGDVLVIGATNRPWDIDKAIISRLETKVYIPLPDAKARSAMFTILIPKLNLGDSNFKKLVSDTEGFSGRDIERLVRKAKMGPFYQIEQARYFKQINNGFYSPCERNSCGAIRMRMSDFPGEKYEVRGVSMGDFEKALEKCNPTVSETDLEEYEKWTEDFGQNGK